MDFLNNFMLKKVKSYLLDYGNYTTVRIAYTRDGSPGL